jgi:SHS2 domain-containing protein
MSYRYLDDAANGDIAFEAVGETLEELFICAVDALLNTMVEPVDSVLAVEQRRVELKDDSLQMLLFNFLQEVILFKDSEQLLLRLRECHFLEEQGEYRVVALLAGERRDPLRHRSGPDVKGLASPRFQLEKAESGWRAAVILKV